MWGWGGRLEATGIEITLDRDRLPELTQYAVPLRHDELLDAESLEREVLVVLVDKSPPGRRPSSAQPARSWGNMWGNMPHGFQANSGELDLSKGAL